MFLFINTFLIYFSFFVIIKVKEYNFHRLQIECFQYRIIFNYNYHFGLIHLVNLFELFIAFYENENNSPIYIDDSDHEAIDLYLNWFSYVVFYCLFTNQIWVEIEYAIHCSKEGIERNKQEIMRKKEWDYLNAKIDVDNLIHRFNY